MSSAIDFNNVHFGFIGLGLIGGSIARAIRVYWPNARITVYNPSEDTLCEAIADGVANDGHWKDEVEEGHPFNGEAFATCDCIFLCAPVQKNEENLRELAAHISPSAIITDIGSTKRNIHDAVRAQGLEAQFIGGHPMTGSERTRYRNSKASLLENAFYMVVPEPEVSQDKVDTYVSFVEGIHALPLVIDASFHDYAVAGISHLPHVVAAGLVNLVKHSDNPEAIMHTIAAGGFKDITRISSSSPEMWREICMTNGDNIVKLLDDYVASLQEMRETIASRDAGQIYEFFDSAREYRDSFAENNSGALNRSFNLYVDIEDHPASLAEVVTLLAVNSISIKNIGITHNREYQEGALRVEFYSVASLEEAREILTSRNYNVH